MRHISAFAVLLASSLSLACNSGPVPAPVASTPTPTAAAAATAATPEQTAQQFVDLVTQGQFEQATTMFDATMTAAMNAQALGQAWSQVVAQYGAFQKKLNSRQEKIQGFEVVFTNCQFEKGKLALQVTIGADGKVSGFFMKPAF